MTERRINYYVATAGGDGDVNVYSVNKKREFKLYKRTVNHEYAAYC